MTDLDCLNCLYNYFRKKYSVENINCKSGHFLVYLDDPYTVPARWIDVHVRNSQCYFTDVKGYSSKEMPFFEFYNEYINLHT
jgi:hypothetical protein